MYYANPLTALQQALVSLPGGAPAPSSPQYYGPTHQALTQAFQNSLAQQNHVPQMMSQLMRYPNFWPSELGGFGLNTYAPQGPNWRVDWFAPPQNAAPAAAAPANTGAGGLLQAWGVRQGQNDVPGGSADGATGNGPGGEGTADGVGGTSGVGGAAGDGDGGAGGG